MNPLLDIKEPIQISDSASKQLNKILKDNTDSEKYLRIGVKGGGCSGLSYILDLETKQEFDGEFEVNGVKFIMDQRHIMYLEGTKLEFSDGLDNRGFEFVNPNATETCGCGSSFSA